MSSLPFGNDARRPATFARPVSGLCPAPVSGFAGLAIAIVGNRDGDTHALSPALLGVSVMNQRQRQVLYTGLLILAVVTTVLRSVQQLWDNAVIAAAIAGGLAWFERRWLRPGLRSWLNGTGWHWIDEPTHSRDNPADR
ncbi:hypothetical protein HDA40_002088 [Hamadaea flava]|uniref:Uncharacterized protein n=1 Tax=Hamadaea flava TaxID=1742688 RepID=A0ABV8LJI2_9ACTN|nr:hypothetical protein [Hamadaea flava]MCP2323581.1 hypothetical protein [Hamadaea flava]